MASTRKRSRSQYAMSAASASKRRRTVSKRSPASAVIYRNIGPQYVAYSGMTAPDRTIVKMTYSTFINMSSGVASFVNQIFRGNSIFDPDLSGVGHQALSHDQWATLYEYYRVLSSSIEVNFTSTDDQHPVLCVVLPTEEGTVIDTGNPDTYTESPYAKHKQLGLVAANSSCVIKHWMNTARILGVRRFDSGFDEAAAFGANPTSGAQWFWHIYTAVRTGTPSCEAHVKITYTVEMLKRKQLTAS